MKRKKVLLLIMLYTVATINLSLGSEIEKNVQLGDVNEIPKVKVAWYGFDILDIGRGLEGKIDIELSGTFTSKHMWHGLDLLDDHGAFIPVGTIIFGDSGFSAKIIDVYPLSSGFEKSVERNYAGFYTGAFLKDTPLATSFTLNYYYYGKPKVGGHKGDAQEIGSTFFWPKLFALGDGYITPSYYLGYIWASKSNSNNRGCEGFIHVFGLAYDYDMPNFWPSGKKQAFRFSGDLTYNDGFGGSAISHDWSHAVFGLSTSVKRGNLTITPSLNYQISMDDSINEENELWCGINATYRF